MSERFDEWRRLTTGQPTDSPELAEKRYDLRRMRRITVGTLACNVVLGVTATVAQALHNAGVTEKAVIMAVPAVLAAGFAIKGTAEAKDHVVELEAAETHTTEARESFTPTVEEASCSPHVEQPTDQLPHGLPIAS